VCRLALSPEVEKAEALKPEVSRSKPEVLHSHLGHYPRNGFDRPISLFCIFTILSFLPL